MTSQKRILIVGYYGFQNAGDEKCLLNTVSLLSKVYNNPLITVVYPHNQSGKFNSISRFSPVDLLIGVKNCDLVIFGGGGLIQDVTSSLSLYYYLFILLLAKLFSKKSILLSQGVGPVSRPFSKCITQVILNQTTDITVRDQASFHLLKQNLKVKTDIHLSADMVFDNAIVTIPKAQIPEHKIGLSIRKVPIPKKNWQHISEFVLQLKPLIFLDLQSSEDSHYFYSLDPAFEAIDIHDMNQQWVEKTVTWPNITIVIGMRYHSLVAASLSGCPFLALAYDDKVLHLAQSLGQPCVDVRGKISQSEISQSFEYIKENYVALQKTLISRTQVLVKQAQVNQSILEKHAS
ncbi:MAG: polysaccharide pyruvyl transferase CsaB [Candidatus Margulisbacteria bacterium]|nr:polysaccharide pyruvyl transferase CsaB [Candidatus Margulisiibacteriota bacterium]